MSDDEASRPGRVPSGRRGVACALAVATWLGARAAAGGDPDPDQAAANVAVPVTQMAQMQTEERADAAGLLSEIRVGVLDHDIGVFGTAIEDGIDGNIELQFISPDFLDIILSPRPHVGLSINSDGNTSQLYAGLAWDWTFLDPFFVEATLALSAHDGRLDETTADEKGLGCRVLFRESVSLGARFLERHSISLMLSHISNAGLCDPNKGLDTFGIRYGYRF